ncbi:MAG: hypothetical protein M9953_02600 [Thermomicrobiales bacterium]|nr:hypothetical protein [Thermomicrobiales bacterium]MCO5217922.1 hypothetical protein [Thermomicrobiales bacterium]MCO5224204.1 hypothetical protein [Thermomicrobiales bacterium]MCO5228863.1 hypothetical protein [Thermomicrobiales bacterium]
MTTPAPGKSVGFERGAHRIVQLLVGLFCYGIGIAFLVRSALGASPWDVLTQGISHHVPLSFGTITVILSGVVLLLWIPLRQKPGVGTILNALLVGPSADIGFRMIPEVSALWLRIAFIVIGIIVVGLATGLYIGSRFGPGPRDGLMTGLHRVTRRPIWQVRASIELVVVALGWLLGGIVGVGTVAFAVLIGPVCQYFMRIFYIPLSADAEPNVVASVADETDLMVEEAPSY